LGKQRTKLYQNHRSLIGDITKIILVFFLDTVYFNFLKAPGQHMENAGMDDVQTEAGVFASNTWDYSGWQSLLSCCKGTLADIRSSVEDHMACSNNGWSRRVPTNVKLNFD